MLEELPPKEWRPYPKQERFLRLGCFEALYGGAAGGGKSDALLLGASREVGNRHHRALLLRREFPELQRTLLARAGELYPFMGGHWREKTKTWYFESGATIELGHAENEKDVSKYDGAPYNFIGIDEATHWTEWMYRFLISRCRSSHGLPLRFRSTSNPGGIGHDFILRRFSPWLYPLWATDYVGPRAASGEVLYYLPSDGKSDAEQVVARETPGAIGRSFVGAKVSDNASLADTDYERNLALLDPLTRAQKRDGDWMARPGARVFFKRETIELVDMDDVPNDALLVRYWDRAATEDPKADWTSGLLLAFKKPTWWIVDVVRGQWEPADVERVIRQVAALDDPDVKAKVAGLPMVLPHTPGLRSFLRDARHSVRLVLERDPAAAGKFEAAYYLRELAGYDVHAVPPQGDKITRAKPVSAQADAGNVRMVRGPWNRVVLDVLEGFPSPPDDDVDALSGAFRQTLAMGAGAAPRARGPREWAPHRAGGY